MYRLTGISLLFIFFSACTETNDLSDAYGNFEVDVTTISSEANGRLLFLDVDEGVNLEIDKLVALVDTTQCTFLNVLVGETTNSNVCIRLILQQCTWRGNVVTAAFIMHIQFV